MRRRLMIMTAVLGMAVLLGGCGSIRQKKDEITAEAGQKLELKATDFFDVSEKKAGEIVFDISKVDVDTVGVYVAIASYGKKTYTITIRVEDTTAPSVNLRNRYVITNDIAGYDMAELAESVYDASDYSLAFVRFDRAGDLDVMDEAALKALTDSVPAPCDQEKLAGIRTEDVPEKEGIYRSVLAATDLYGNTHLEEVYIIFDKTGALIEAVADRTIYVPTGDIDKEPAIDPAEYVVTDNVDGAVPADRIGCTPELNDRDKHEYVIHVSYTDRAGNESRAEFLVTVKEEPAVNNSGNGGNKEGSSNIAGSAGNSSGSAGNGNSGSSGGSGTGEDIDAIAEKNQQAAVEAGYYNITVATDGGYQVMVRGDEFEYGIQLLRDYLAGMGCHAPNGMGGGWINPEKDQYICYARGDAIVPLVTEDDEEFWD